MSDPRPDRSTNIDRIIRLIPSLVSTEKNDILMKPITLYEVEEVVFQMREGTTPVPDGFTVNFFHRFWDLIKMEVLRIMEDSRLTKRLLPAFNATFITLIPKCEGAYPPNTFRPISLYNVIYKITTRVIANHLKPMLSRLISLEQSGFVEGRHITDGIILVHELIHSIRSQKMPGMLIKLDIAKACDKLNWYFMW